MRALSSRQSRRQRARNTGRQTAAVLEALDRRQMLTTVAWPVFWPTPDLTGPGTTALDGGASVDWRADGTVHVTGTSGNDYIALSRTGVVIGNSGETYQVTVNGRTVTLGGSAASPINRFDVDAGDGNDSVQAVSTLSLYYGQAIGTAVAYGMNNVWFRYRPPLNVPVSLYGGAGDDTLVGGDRDDTLDGGAGVDRLTDIDGHNLFITDAGPVESADAGRWSEIAGGGYIGLTIDGTLHVRGTDAADVVTVGWDLTHPTRADQPLTVTINGVSSLGVTPFNSAVARVQVDAAGGDDQVTVDPNVLYPVTVLGGAGDDTLNGDAGADELRLNADVTGNPGRPVDRTLGGTAFVLQLPSGATIAWDPAGILSIEGTSGDDDITFDWFAGGIWGDQPQLVITVNNDTWTVRPDDGVTITRVEVDAGDGNDRVQAGLGIQTVVVKYPGIYWYGDGTAIWPNAGGVTMISFEIPVLVRGGTGNDTIWGGAGTDTLYGGDGDDELRGGGDDQLYGDAGADFLLASGGPTSLYGGAGDDRLQKFDSDGLLVPGDAGDAPLPYGRGVWFEVGGVVAGVAPDGTLYVRGTAGDDVITITRPDAVYFEGAPTFVTANGVTQSFESWSIGLSINRVQVEAGDGNDHVTVGPRLTVPTSVDGGAGDDTLDVVNDNYAPITLTGGDGDDTLAGDAGTDVMVLPAVLPPPIWIGPPIEVWPPIVVQPWPPINGYPWPPIEVYPIDPLPPVVTLPEPRIPEPPEFAPTPSSHVANDRPVVRFLVLDAPTGPTVTKAGTRVTLAGGASILWRADGVFVIRGTSGDDVIRVGRAGAKGKNATLLVKVNNVTRAFRVGTAPIRRVDIDAGDGDDAVLLGGSDVLGSVFASPLDIASTIAGGRGNDTLVGGSKADVIHGNAGRDSLSGGAGNDSLYGDAGTDTLTGGAGRDRSPKDDDDLLTSIERVG